EGDGETDPCRSWPSHGGPLWTDLARTSYWSPTYPSATGSGSACDCAAGTADSGTRARPGGRLWTTSPTSRPRRAPAPDPPRAAPPTEWLTPTRAILDAIHRPPLRSWTP